jgi:hypothetical protein
MNTTLFAVYLDLSINLLQHLSVDVFDLVCQNVALLRQFADRVGVCEGAVDVRVERIDLFRGRAGGIEDNGLDVETVGGLHHHATKLWLGAVSIRIHIQDASSVPGHLPEFRFFESPSRQREKGVLGAGLVRGSQSKFLAFVWRGKGIAALRILSLPLSKLRFSGLSQG